MKRVRLTREGFEKLRIQLEELRKIKRPAVIRDIAEARSKGDLRENAEYDAAKEAQAHLEKRIAELEIQLSHVEFLDDERIDATKVYLGSTVRLKDAVRNKEIEYMIVSKEEADHAHGRISMDSPVGRALLGKEAGARVSVQAPAGTLTYEILSIRRS